MSNSLTNSKSNISKNKSKSFIDILLEYESIVVFGGLGCAILGIIILSGLFHAGPSQRDSVVFNSAGALVMGVGFIYIVITFMGSEINIYGNKIDIGMIIYVAIVLFVMFVLGG